MESTRATNASSSPRNPVRLGLHAVAFCAFLLAALWNSRAVLEAPKTLVTFRLPANAVLVSDISRNIAQTAYASRTLWHDPWRFFDGQMCFPTPSSVSLGEHMLGEGLLGIPAYLLWDDPVATFNFVVTARPLIGALSMYALAYYWTGSFAAALIAGFLFGFHPIRLRDLLHPSVVGNEWIPAILLSLHLLFAKGRWRYAVLLAVLAALQMLESMYVLLQLALAVGIYGSYLSWRHRASLLNLLPKLAFVSCSLVLVATWIFGPYLESREVWGVHQGRLGFPVLHGIVLFGGHYYAGTCLLILAALGLLDRLRGARADRRHDPRWPFVIVALAATWFVFDWTIPGTDHEVPSLRTILLNWLPGVDGIRAPSNVFAATVVALGLPAAYGVRALIEKFGLGARAILASLIAVACVAEVFVPAVSKRSFGLPMPSEAFRIRPAEEDVAAIRELPPGPVLDLPLFNKGLGVLFMARAILLGAYHERPQAACKASFITPTQFDLAAISVRLPKPAAAQELWALGFRSVIFSGKAREPVIRALSKPGARPRIAPIAAGPTARVFRFDAGAPSTTDVASLVAVPGSQQSRPTEAIQLSFRLRSGGQTFRHPDPVLPTEFTVVWFRDEAVVQSGQKRANLPLALDPRRTAVVAIKDEVPSAPGAYRVTLALAANPGRVIGEQRVLVTDP